MSDRLHTFSAELSALLRTMPGLTATAAELADWFERKAALLDLVAAGSGGETGAHAAELARVARERARELRGRSS